MPKHSQATRTTIWTDERMLSSQHQRVNFIYPCLSPTPSAWHSHAFKQPSNHRFGTQKAILFGTPNSPELRVVFWVEGEWFEGVIARLGTAENAAERRTSESTAQQRTPPPSDQGRPGVSITTSVFSRSHSSNGRSIRVRWPSPGSTGRASRTCGDSACGRSRARSTRWQSAPGRPGWRRRFDR